MVFEDNSSSKIQDLKRLEPSAPDRMAHPLDRIAAFLVDVGLLFVLGSVLVAPLQRKIRESQLADETDQVIVGILLLLLVVGLASVVYQVLFQAIKGATPGKLFFGLRVVDVWSGKRPSFTNLFVRSVLWWLDTVAGCFPLFAMYSDPLRRPFHDRVANTIVVSVRGRVGFPPAPREMAFVKAMFVSLYVLGFVIVLQETKTLVSAVQSDEAGHLLEMMSPELCEEVSIAHKGWPIEKGQTPQRLSVALALFAGGLIDESCLDHEAFFQFRTEDQKEMAYLARAFTTSEESELSDRYLEKVCEEAPDSEACGLSKVISSWTSRDWQEASNGFAQLMQSGSVYVKVWAIKHFEKTKEYAKELEVIEGLWPLEGLSPFLNSHRAIALWGMHRREESRVATTMALEGMSKEKQIGLAGWICYNEIEDSCSKDLPNSCRLFKDLTEVYTTALDHDIYAITHLRISECEGRDQIEGVRDVVSNPMIVKLVSSILEVDRGDRASAIEGLREIFETAEVGSITTHEAAKRMSSLTTDPDDLEQLFSFWMENKPADLWNFSSLGDSLVDSFSRLGSYERALATGSRLLMYDPDKPHLREKMVVAAFKSGKRALAQELLNEMSTSVRRPASEDEFEAVKQELRRGRK